MSNCENFDVTIVGAGPAGSTAAIMLASKGLKVLLIDKQPFPRPKLCGGLLTFKTIRFLQNQLAVDLNQMTRQAVIHFKSRSYAIENRSRKLVHGKLDFPFHFVDRKKYDHYLLQHAQEAGATIRLKTNASALAGDNCILLRNKDKGAYIVKSEYIIGADGVLSRVRRHLSASGRIETDNKKALAMAIEAKVPKRLLPGLKDVSTLYFDVVPWGYAWRFPGKRHYIVGMCCLKGKCKSTLSKRFDEFVRSLGVPANSLKCSAHLIPYGNFLNKPVSKNVLLIGDAAGFADPLLGEGIYYAHKSGQLAAQAILKSKQKHVPVAEIYQHLLQKSILKEFRYLKRIRWTVYNVLRGFNYHLLGLLFSVGKHTFEAAVHGRRSFNFLKPGKNTE